MKKKYSIKAVLSLMLSVILFCMPVGAFMANRNNTVDVQAQDTESNAKESKSETDSKTEATTSSGNDTQKQKCTCKDKCSQNARDEECEVCKEDYTRCDYVSPNVKITIDTPTGWHNDTAKVPISVEDVSKTKNFTIKTVQAKIGQNGSWTDITEDMYIEISENSTVYVLVTDQDNKTYEKNRYIKCFDFDKPTLNAAVSDGLLSIQAQDTDSGIKAVYVNGYEFKKITNGALNIRLQQFDAGYQYFSIQAMDNAGNMSEVYKTANPYYTDPETEDSNESNPTDSGSGKKTSGSDTEVDKEKGKEFYLIIDRDGDEKMVYFLTKISENDLLNTTTENSETLPKNSAALDSAIPVSGGALSNNNVKNKQAEETEDAAKKEDTDENTEGKKKENEEENSMTTYIILGIAVVVVIGAYYLKVVRKKKEDFLDEEDEEDYDEEYEDEEETEETEDDFFEQTDEEVE